MQCIMLQMMIKVIICFILIFSFTFILLATMPTIKTGNKIIMETTIKSILYIFIMSISLIGIVISALLTESMPLMIFILIELITISFYYSPTNNN